MRTGRRELPAARSFLRPQRRGTHGGDLQWIRRHAGAGGTQPKDRQAGQGLVEYGLILVLVVIVSIAGLVFFGTAVSGYLSHIGSSV